MEALAKDRHCILAREEMEKLGIGYQREKAEEVFTYLLQYDSEKSKEELVKLAVFYREGGELEKSNTMLMDILKVDKQYDSAKDTLVKLGIVYKEQGLLDKALHIFIEIISIDKTHTKVKSELTKIAVLFKEHDDPFKAFEILLALL